MLHSLELRSPFLDTEVIDFAFTKVPDDIKADFRQRKIIFQKNSRVFIT